jgi:hypothetical protein
LLTSLDNDEGCGKLDCEDLLRPKKMVKYAGVWTELPYAGKKSETLEKLASRLT